MSLFSRATKIFNAIIDTVYISLLVSLKYAGEDKSGGIKEFRIAGEENVSVIS